MTSRVSNPCFWRKNRKKRFHHVQENKWTRALLRIHRLAMRMRCSFFGGTIFLFISLSWSKANNVWWWDDSFTRIMWIVLDIQDRLGAMYWDSYLNRKIFFTRSLDCSYYEHLKWWLKIIKAHKRFSIYK